MNINRYLGGAKTYLQYAREHTVVSGMVILALVGAGYFTYKKLNPTTVETRYVLGTVATGTIISTVSGSGQISPTQQVDVKPKASGDITSVMVSEGQAVAAGQVIAYLDSTDAQKAVRDAKTNLESAQLQLDKLQRPEDALTITQAQNNVAKATEAQSNATDNLAKAYNDGFDDVTNIFLDFPDTITGLHDLLYKSSTQLGGGSQWNIDFYKNAINQYSDTLQGTQFANDAADKYNTAKAAYDKAFADYKATSRSADTATIAALVQETSDAANDALAATKSANNLIRLYKDTLANRNLTSNAYADTHLSSLNTFTSTLSSHADSLTNALNTIKTSKQAIADTGRTLAESQASLSKLSDGPDAIDLRSAQISVQQKQNALTDAQNTLADYAVRAPFSGTIATLDAKRGDSASTGTAIATLITKQQIAELSLNEIDATKVKVGDKATLTFDAIDDLTLTGAVASVDALGTVTQGVVSYTVKIGLSTQDNRVKPGMTVNANIQTDVHQNVLTVPSSAIKSSNSGTYVLAFEPALSETGGTQGIVSKTTPIQIPVTTGISDDTTTEITAGLTQGQQIVTKTTGSTTKTSAASATSRTGAPGGGLRGL